MRIFRLFLFILAIYILQTTIVSRFAIFTVKPDLVLVTITLLAVSEGLEHGFAAGVLGGLLQDILGGMFFINTLTKGILGFLAGTFKESIFGSEESVAMTAVLAATATEFVLQILMLSFFFDKPVATPLPLFAVLVISSLYNCLLAPLMYRIVKAFGPLLAVE